MTRLATGIPGFDAMVQGGLPAGSSVILQGPPGEEKLRFALMFLAEGLKAGSSGLVVISSQSPDSVLAELRNLGVDIEAIAKEQRLRIVDWYSWSEEPVRDIEERGLVVRSSIDLTNLGVALSRAIASLPGNQTHRAVIELLSPATNVYETTQVYAFAQSAKKKFDRFGFTSLVLLEKDMHSGSEITTLHQPFDGVIEIERTRSGDRIVRKIGVLHLKGTAADPTFRVLEVAEAGLHVVRDSGRTPTTAASYAPDALESQDERARRLTLIMQIAGERLKLNPRDADALFATAAAQATLDDPRGSLQSLERLAELDPNYPGLWVLKTKLHARLGETDRARQSRLRAQQAEPAGVSSAGPTVPCPMCEEPVAADATTCKNCGVKFAPARKLEDELEDLGHAAIQEMVEEDFRERLPPPPVKRPEPKPKKRAEVRAPERKPEVPPPEKPEPAVLLKPVAKAVPRKGLTNGLVLSRGAGRRTGMTNGLRGRTNGLRGRTNGLTNGLGRTNGLTNGVGRTNGLTNGLGRTNGLTNGLGRTNGLTNGLGRTNGITNGLGRTNGLTNGLGGIRRGAGFRSSGFRGMMRTAGWKLYVIPLVVASLLLMPLFFVPEYSGPVTPIQIDGQFGDWSALSTMSMSPGGLSPNVDVVGFGMVENLGPHAFYVRVAGTALQGGGAAPGTMDSVRIFVDTDASAATGYRIDGIGADRLIEVSGYTGIVRSSTLWEFDANRDARDWSGWIKGTATPAAATGSQIEAEAEWLSSASSLPPVAVVHTVSWDNVADAGEFPVSLSQGSLTVVTVPEVPEVIAGAGVSLLRLSLTGHGPTVQVDSIRFEIVGTGPLTAALSLRLMEGTAVLGQVIPTSRDVTFSFPPIAVADGSTVTLAVVGDFSGAGGETLGIRLPAAHPFGIDAPAVGLRENPGARLLGYLGSVPATPRVDGAFAEWTSPSIDSPGDVTPRENDAIDLVRQSAIENGGSSYLYADVTGRIFLGTSVPEAPKPTPVPGPPVPADTDRDTVPDTIDPLPLDFNNDGIADADSNGDYDGDLILDYGFVGGTDTWLNTTLPGTFPPPYAGRAVSVYIGPTERPPSIGEDALRFFLDLDNSTGSGYVISGIGADRLVEVRGKDREVSQSGLLAFTGSFPGEWSWSPISPVAGAVGYHAVELSVPLTVANVYVEAGDFWGSSDSTAASAALAPSFVSFRVSPASVPMSVPWIQVGPQPSGTLIDGGSNAPTTVYNHQRKVVRAGDVSPDTACDATNSDGCWYAVFHDQKTPEGGTSYLRNTNHATETACTANKVALSTQGSGPVTSITLSSGQTACWYVDATTGRPVAAGNWEAFLDVYPVRGIAGYGEGSQAAPRNAAWDTSTFGAESNAANAAATIEWVVVKASPLSSADVIMAVLSSDSSLYVQTWDGSSWTANWNTALGGSVSRRFDVAFEQGSGDALVVFGDGSSQLKYRKRVSGTWDSSNQNAGTTLGSFPYWVRAESRPTNDDIFVAVITDGTALRALRWSGSANTWGDQTTFPNPGIRDQEAMDITFDRSTGDAFVIWGDGSNNLRFREFTTSWQTNGTAYSGLTNKVAWVVAAHDPIATSSKMVVGMVLDSGDFDFGAFDGSSWVSRPGLVQVRVKTERGLDVAFEKDTGKAVFIFDTSANPNQMSWRTWTSSGFSSVTVESGSTGSINTMQLRADPLSNAMIALYADSNSDLFHRAWSGTAWGALGPALETTVSSITTMREAFMFAWITPVPEYDVVLDIWNVNTNAVVETVGSCIDLTSYGEDVQCLVSSVAQKSLSSDQVVRARVAHSSTEGRVRVDYDDADTTGNSRVTLPTSTWDRIVIMRSSDTSGSTWGSQIVLASGDSADSPLLLDRESAEPSIAIDSAGFLHLVWVSASAAGEQSTLDRVRYTKTTAAYPTQSELAATGSWDAITNVDDASTGFMPTVSTDASNNPHVAWSGSKTSGTVYYRNKAGGAWQTTVSWGTTYTGLSVDVAPGNDFVSLARFYDAATDEIQYTVCKTLSPSNCDASSEFTKWDGTAGADTVVASPEVASYPSLVHTYETNGDAWVAYAKDVDGSTRAIYARMLDYPSGGWATAETVDSATGTFFTKPSIGIDRDNNVHALYVRTTGPLLFYRTRVGGSWGSDTVPGTETINLGTKVSGTFASDVQWEDGALIQYREASGFSAKLGSFNVGTGIVGTTVPVTGVGFQPDVVIFWWSGRTESTDTVSGVDHKRGFGVAVSPTDRRAVFSQSDDGALVAATDAGHQADAAIGALTITGTIDGLADLQSMDAGGFTLVIDDQFATDLRVHYLALGGIDLTNAATGMLTEPASAGTQDIASVGFQPDAVILFSAMIGADPPGTAVDSTMMIGLAAGSSPANAVWAAASNDGSDPTQTRSYSRAGESIAFFDSGIAAMDGRAGVTSWLSNGFRLNWAEVGGSRRVHYLALKGGQYLVGDVLTQTDTTTPIVESGFGFTPRAVLIGGSTQAQNAADTPSIWDEFSLGAFTSATERGAQGTEDEDMLATVEVGTQIEFDAVVVDQGGTPGTLEALTDVQSVDADGFTLIMDDADDLQGFVWYLAFGGYAAMDVQYDWTGVPAASTHTLHVKAHRDDENFLVQVLTPPSTWNTRLTISATSSSSYAYTMTTAEYDTGSPTVRFIDANSVEGSLSNLYLDMVRIASGNARQLVDASSDHPTLLVRAPNHPTYGSSLGSLYWNTSTSETYFYYIPEFETVILPIFSTLLVLLVWRRRFRRPETLATERSRWPTPASAGISTAGADNQGSD